MTRLPLRPVRLALLAAASALCTLTASAKVGASRPAAAPAPTTTQRLYLSGHGCDDMVQWDFRCSDGRNSGQWTQIGVPSCWELQGFGTYQYGMKFYGKASPEGIADERGEYRYEFRLPAEWEGGQVELIFEAAMTELSAQINGRKAVGSHHGGFTRVTADVSDRVFFGDRPNVLSVTVAKESSIPQVNLAERRADYWNFGGLIRPVFVVRRPATNIERLTIQGSMEGRVEATAYLNRALAGASVRLDVSDSRGRQVATQTRAVADGSDRADFDLSVGGGVATWSAETPALYHARFTLIGADGQTLHVEQQRFGFRTIEERPGDGLYVNGHKVSVRGVNRHSFRPESGRTLSPAKNLEDVLLIKSMNMNAVRLSHYPADPEFLDYCDSLGLYVMEELPGWHWAHETIVGRQLVGEMIRRDVNHPSIIWWSNGNEGGFNYELEPEFHRWDPQHRTVIYPWANRNGYETMHYRSYGESQDYMRKPQLFMPTEFLHGLYDGGHGAGLKDYWDMMYAHPRCVGGFLWDLADEGVVRTDLDGQIDCVGNYGADGIVGPHLEREGSYYTIREVWCPVQLTASWLTPAPTAGPRRVPGARPADGASAQAQPGSSEAGGLTLAVSNRYDFRPLSTVTFHYDYLQMPHPGQGDARVVRSGDVRGGDIAPRAQGWLTLPAAPDGADALRLTATDADGMEIMQWGWALRPSAGPAAPTAPASPAATRAAAPSASTPASAHASDDGGFHSCLTFDDQTGRIAGAATPGHTYTLAGGPRFVAARRADRSLDQFYNHDDKQAERKKTLYTTFDDPGEFCGFTDRDGVRTAHYRWGCLDSVRYTALDASTVRIDAHYNFHGVVDVMGIQLDYPEQNVQAKAWVGQGPYRVWQNRMQGPQYGHWQTPYNDAIPGESFTYPEFKGYFASTDWMDLQTTEGHIVLTNLQPTLDHVGVYTPRDGRDALLYTLPATGLSLLRVIPAVRNKVNTTDLNGPSAQPAWAEGSYVASFILHFD